MLMRYYSAHLLSYKGMPLLMILSQVMYSLRLPVTSFQDWNWFSVNSLVLDKDRTEGENIVVFIKFVAIKDLVKVRFRLI